MTQYATEGSAFSNINGHVMAGLAATVLFFLHIAIPPFAAASATDRDRANSALDAWQLSEALVIAQHVLHAQPQEPANWILAARVQHQRGEHLSALRLLHAARAHTQGMSHLEPRVEGSARYAPFFSTIDTEHFRIRYIGKDEIVAVYAKEVLENAHREIGSALGYTKDAGQGRIVVEVYPNARGLARATGLTVEEIETSGTIAVCKFHRLMITSPLATVNGYGWADTLAHEFAHLVISSVSHNNVPIWLHEGIAKFYESLWSGDAGRALGIYGENLLAEALENNALIPFDDMHPSMAKLPSQESAGLAFAEVFSMVEFLDRTYGRDSIPRLLQSLASHQALETSLKEIFGKSLPDLEKAWMGYLRKRHFRRTAGAAPQRIRLADPAVTAPSEAPEALETINDKRTHELARLGELLELRGHVDAATVEYERAYKHAGVRYITLVTRLARAYTQTGRANNAIDLITRGLAAHPDNSDAHLVAGRLHRGAGAAEKAQRHFEAVRLRNPYNPEIHVQLAELYAEANRHAAAQEEARLLKISRQPASQHSYDVPFFPPANAEHQGHVRVVGASWQTVTFDGKAPRFSVPLWDHVLDVGTHTLAVQEPQDNPNAANVSFTVKANQTTIVRLP